MSEVKDAASGVVVKADQSVKPMQRMGSGGKVLQNRHGNRAVTETHVRAFEGDSPAWTTTPHYARALIELRARRVRRLLMWFALVVLLPTLAATGYMVFVATPRYTSEFEFTYQTYRGPTSLATGLVQSVIGTSQQNTVDLGSIVYEYLRSPTLADKLDRALGLRKEFSKPGIDWLSRLSASVSRESFLDYFRSRVSVAQGLGGYLHVKVQTADPVLSQNLAKAIVADCDQMIDDLSSRARKDEIQFAEAELARQEDRVRKARVAMTDFQNKHGDQDPNRAATQLGTIVGSLESDLASARTQLANAAPGLQLNSPIVGQIKLKIASLEQQLKGQQSRLATDASGTKQPYSDVLNEYSALQIEQDFAKSAYLAAQQGLVVARANAASKQNYMIDFAPPNLPDRISYMVAVEAVGTVFLVALMLFGFGSLVIGAARDQIAG